MKVVNILLAIVAFTLSITLLVQTHTSGCQVISHQTFCAMDARVVQVGYYR